MALPKSVQKQAAEADRLVRVVNGSTDPNDAAPAFPPDALPPEVSGIPAAPVAQAQPPQQPARQAARQAAPPPAPPPQAQPPGDTWEQRYHVLQGKYNAEIPGLQGQLQNAMTALGNMGRELDSLKAQLAQRQAAPPPAPATPAVHRSAVTPQDEQTWGADMIDMVRRGAAEEAQRLMEPVAAENERLRAEVSRLRGDTDRVAASQQQSAQQVFWTRMNELVPDWAVLNTDPGYLKWLGLYDPMLRAVRQERLTEASQQLDWQATAAFFNAYKATLPPPQVPNPQQELAAQVVPARTRAASPVVQQAAGAGGTIEIWSSDEINQFYTDVGKGRYRNDPAEQKRMNDAISLAVAEGRVR